MRHVYYDKSGLYKEIAHIKNTHNLEENTYNIDLIKHCKSRGILLDVLPYKTSGLRGMAVLGDDKTEDIILLNNSRGFYEQNFDCGHEFIHLNLHRSTGHKTFNCFDKVQACQNPFYEWHANEGSAEFLVPYKVLLPLIKQYRDYLSDYDNINSLKNFLADTFMVPSAVIKFRFDNLQYEIYQFLQGITMNKVELLSLNQQKQRRINVKSINDIYTDDFNRKVNETF